MSEKDAHQSTVDEILSVDGNEDDPESSIIEKPELLEIDNVPDAERIVGREEHMEFLAKQLQSMRTNDVDDNVLLWGETGTGKTLVAKHVSKRLERLTEDSENPIVSAYLNPDPNSTYTSTFRNLAQQVNAKASDPVNVPYQGLSAEHYRKKKLWPIVEREFPGGIVVIIDELDKHEDINEVLYTLSRPKEKDGTDAPVVTIGISNNLDFKSEIGSRQRSTLQPEHRTFTPYDEQQLVDILENRRDAFYDGTLGGEVIPTAASLAAKEHGDARRAVRLFRKAGELAQERGDERVTVQHVKDADDLVEVELFMETIQGTPLAGKLLLFALTRLMRDHPDKQWFRTSEIHEAYERISRDVNEKPITYNRALDALNKLITTGVLESKKIEGGDDGKYRSYSLQIDVESTRSGLIESTPELRELMGR